MSLFRKLVPGKGDKDSKDNGNSPAPANEQAAKPANAAKPGSAPTNPAAPTAEEAQSLRKQAGQFFEAAGLAGKNGPMADVNELGGKVRPTDKQQSYEMSHETDMLQLLSAQAGLDYIKLGDVPKSNITPELLTIITSTIARQYKVFPIGMSKERMLTIAISDPLNVRIVDDLRLSLQGANVRDVHAVVANEEEIVDYINLYYGIGDTTLEHMVADFEAEDTSSGLENTNNAIDLTGREANEDDAPIIRFVNLLLMQAIKDRASDLHIEPFQNMVRIRYRVDGALREISAPPRTWMRGIVSRFKVIANLDISESRLPQDGRVKLAHEGREIDLRISTLPVIHGECVVMRILDKSMMQLGVAQIGMTDVALEHFMKMIERPNGIVLVTGPTGSGKTTTLYAAINEINDPTEKIITTEDPVEYQVEGLVQVNINVGVGLTFGKCLRAILRQDPDVILVGEIRDVETAQIAIQASLTGHLVFSTLHTNSAALTVTRLIDMGIEPFLMTSTLEGIVGQRLVRTVCQRCARPYRAMDDELKDYGFTRADVEDLTFLKGEGCEDCANSGYRGRLGIFEVMLVGEEMKTLILDRASTDELQAHALDNGMLTMRQDGWMKICVGITTFDEVSRQTPRESAKMIKKEMEAVVGGTLPGAATTVAGSQTVRTLPTMDQVAAANATPAVPAGMDIPNAPADEQATKLNP